MSSDSYFRFGLNLPDFCDIRVAVSLTGEQKISVKNRAKPDRVETLSDLETEVIGLFVQLARALSQPRSLAEIYGLLFISASPLAMDDLIERLGLAKGTASQGLKFLRNIGAIKRVYVHESRRTHYESVGELRQLVARFLKDQIVPQLESSQEHLERIANLVQRLPPEDRSRVNHRVALLQDWGKQSRQFVPVFTKMLAG